MPEPTQPLIERLFLRDAARSLDFAVLSDYIHRSVLYMLRTGAKSDQPDGWKAMAADEMADKITTHLMAGIEPAISYHVVELSTEEAQARLAIDTAPAADRG